MEISIDEAGSFVNKGSTAGSWCVVAAFAIPETEKRKVKEALRRLKVDSGVSYQQEIKLGKIEESVYLGFLKILGKTNCTLFAVATDSYYNGDDIVSIHRDTQARMILSAVPAMKYQGGKEALKYLSEQFNSISPQLYSQLVCQIQLMQQFTENAIDYYVQRQPKTLQNFKWRVDQKQPTHKTHFEDAFEKYAPGLLQTFSLDQPGRLLDWCDYRPMKKFMYGEGELPDYLIERFPNLVNEVGLNIQKIIRDDIKFVDSKKYDSVQIVDLLASGLRRLLRHEFSNNEQAARLLGELFVQAPKGKVPIKLVSFGNSEPIPSETAALVSTIKHHSRSMLLKS
ncbi:DUF3800 domain-containing protein [Vibrio alginolyticus]|nr:DUF3800 domain-containing protein [Vibrio alginolyticus]